MRSRTIHVPLLVLAAITIAPGAPGPTDALAQQSPAALRPTEVTATLSGSPRLYDGSYRSQQVSRVCGELSEIESFGERVFVVEFPDEPAGNITSLSFNSTALVGGVTVTDRFHVVLGVRRADGGTPPNYVVNRRIPGSRTTGTATLTVTGATTELNVQSMDELRVTMNLKVVCRPRG